MRKQLATLYSEAEAGLVLDVGQAWRSMHHHGRALNALLPRAVDDLATYDIQEGEIVAGVVLGWNFGEGHLHDEQLLAAVQERCGFAEGELRVVMLESQPIHRQSQRYRIVDAATGLVESGSVAVADMVRSQPWLGDDGDSGTWWTPTRGRRAIVAARNAVTDGRRRRVRAERVGGRRHPGPGRASTSPCWRRPTGSAAGPAAAS